MLTRYNVLRSIGTGYLVLWYLQFAWELFGETCHHVLNTNRTGICHGKHTMVKMFIQI